MKREFQSQLSAINAANNKINGLYSRWAQKRNISGYTVCIFYSLLTEDSLTQKQVREEFEIPKQSVNNIITALKNDGHIILTSSTEDKREKLICLTDQGRSYAQELLAPLFAVEDAVMKKMGHPMVQQMIDTTVAYCSYLEQEMENADL